MIFTTLLTTTIALTPAPTQDLPNIIVFLVDDMGVMDTSVPFLVNSEGCPQLHPLNSWYRTPSMEKLANQGIRFSNFYAQSVSSPSRTSLLTGKNAARHRTTDWINSETNNKSKFTPESWNWGGLDTTDVVYPKLLKAAGYKTIHIGKAHFGPQNSEGENPLNLGFDVNIAGSSIGQPGNYLGENGYGFIGGQRRRAVPDLDIYHGTDTFLSDALTLEAHKEIEKAVVEQRPFYLNLCHYAVHAPFETDKRFIDKYNSQEMSDEAKAFATLIEGMDKSLGDLLQELESLGIAENTLIFFLGDNGSDAPLGGPADYGSSAPLKGKKGSEFEGGTRIPFIASWAKVDANNKFQKAYPIQSGGVQTQMATIMDVFPSILSASGVSTPKDVILDGQDLKRLLTGKQDKKHGDYFLGHYPHEHRGSYYTSYRKGDWKLIYYYNPETPSQPKVKLFNLKNDPYETTDLSFIEKKKLKKIYAQMVSQLRTEKALFPVDKDGNEIKPNINLCF